MHKNAIKKVRGVNFLEILAKNSCFSRVLGLFCSCFSCFFGSTIVFFKKNFLVTLAKIQREKRKSKKNLKSKKVHRRPAILSKAVFIWKIFENNLAFILTAVPNKMKCQIQKTHSLYVYDFCKISFHLSLIRSQSKFQAALPFQAVHGASYLNKSFIIRTGPIKNG